MKKLLKSILASRGYEIRRLASTAPKGGSPIHFLHIGKNAGTQISNVSEQINRLAMQPVIVKHPHDVFLKDIPSDDPYFFSVRHPIARFRSGFYSRKRKGQPRIYSEWSAHEEIAFSEFEHANDLAESLFEDGSVGHKAWSAMQSIRHAAQNQADWFCRNGNFLRIRPPVWIIRQERFDPDLRKFISIAFPEIDYSRINLAADQSSSHANDYADIPPLSQKAKANLTRWYSQDLGFYQMCNDWIEASGKL